MTPKERAESTIRIARKYLKINPVDLAVEAIEHDICDRRGLKTEWGRLRPETQSIIKDVWKGVIRSIFDDYYSDPYEASVARLVSDFRMRRENLGNEWDLIAPEIQQEIKDVWKEIIRESFKQANE